MPKTIIYTTISCGYCVRAKRLLEEKQIPYEEIDVSYNAELRRAMMEKSGGRMTVPQIFIGDTHVGGCNELYELEYAGRLDPILSAA
nr:MAG: glutaredoxin 3 [Hyphomicrobiales bacterium]